MSSSHRTSPHEHRNLLLRVFRADQLSEERYLAAGLSIGRSEANQIRTDDPSVARKHAWVDLAEDGQYLLKTVDHGLTIEVDQEQVHQVTLCEGRQFRIGTLQFECINGLRISNTKTASLEPACPYCQHKAARQICLGPQRCEQCQESLIVFPYQAESKHLVALPTNYGKYQATQFAARGGMAYVLKGFDPEAAPERNEVAIKVLMTANAGVSNQAMLRFKKEISTMRKIDHPRVMPLLNYGNSQRFNYLILPWVGGRSLREKIRRWQAQKKHPEFQEAVNLFLAICDGVQAIHQAGIIHRDLKPANILFDEQAQPIIADLGVARNDDQKTAITQTGMVLGTNDYMAPEQRSNPEDVDTRADLFALGVIFYEVLTLQRPSGAWQPASAINSSVPPVFDHVISSLLQNDPSQRISTIELVIDWLTTLTKPVADSPIHETQPTQEDNKNESQLPSDEIELPITTPINNGSSWYKAGKFIRNHIINRFITSEAQANPDEVVPHPPPRPNKFPAWVWMVLAGCLLAMVNTCNEKPAKPISPKQSATVPLISENKPKHSQRLTNYKSVDGAFQALLISNPVITEIKDGSTSALSHSAHFANDELFQILVFNSKKHSKDLQSVVAIVNKLHDSKVWSESKDLYKGREGTICLNLLAKSNANSDLTIKCKIVLWKGRIVAMVAKGKGTFVYKPEISEFLDSLTELN